ncbi:MAG: DNA alkylation repair protein [Candidatus Cloacimonetes bacterium]|nr:DNA alkylation repair protein [Candidatus Cloacimonadota bacterium]
MKQSIVIKEIRDYLKLKSDKKLIEKYSKFFKEGYDSYGICTEVFNSLLKTMLDKYILISDLDEVLSLGNELFASGKYEEGSLAISFISALRKRESKLAKKKPYPNSQLLLEFDRKVFHQLQIWFDKWILNWAHTDITCSELLGKMLIDNNITIKDFSQWKKSSSKWTRRAVPVSMIALLKVQKDLSPLLNYIDIMMMDTERPVQQGLGWFLREAWKKQPATVEKFLLKWKKTAPRLIFQYASEKMDKEQREKFRRSKKKLA